MQSQTYKICLYCVFLFSSVGYVQQTEPTEVDKYEQMAQLFKLLMKDIKAKDDKIEALENAIHVGTTPNYDHTKYPIKNKTSQGTNGNQIDEKAFPRGRRNFTSGNIHAITTQVPLEKLQDLVQGLEAHLARISKGLASEKAMRIENTESAKLVNNHLEQILEHFKMAMEQHEELMETSVKALKMDIEASIDKTNSFSDKVISVTDQLVDNDMENRQAMKKLAAVVEKIQSDVEEIKPMVLNTLNVNLAFGKSASESSSYPNEYNRGPKAATDGIKSGIWTDSSCTHTQSEMNPWWEVDLEGQKFIKRVVIKNREDCCGHQLRSLVVTVSKVKGGTGEVCGRFAGPGTSGATVTIHCTRTVYGRFLKIQIRSDSPGVLTLCEVEIFSQ